MQYVMQHLAGLKKKKGNNFVLMEKISWVLLIRWEAQQSSFPLIPISRGAAV
jgi:hypothetical protein